MQSLFTGVNLNRTFDLSPRYSPLVCGEVICSDNRRPILTKYSLNSLVISSGLVTARQGWGQVQYLYLVLVLKYIFIST